MIVLVVNSSGENFSQGAFGDIAGSLEYFNRSDSGDILPAPGVRGNYRGELYVVRPPGAEEFIPRSVGPQEVWCSRCWNARSDTQRWGAFRLILQRTLTKPIGQSSTLRARIWTGLVVSWCYKLLRELR